VKGCQIFLGPNIPKRENYTKLPQTIPNYHKLYQITTNYTKLQQTIPNCCKLYHITTPKLHIPKYHKL
jgi:hypothetical protein